MENKIHEYEKIKIHEIASMLVKNKSFMAMFLLFGLLLGIFFSGIQVLLNPVEYIYHAKSTIKLVNAEDMSNQPQTILHVMESKSILESSMNNSGIISGSYIVRTNNSAKMDQYDVIVEGPDEELVIIMVDEIVAQGLSLTEPAIEMSENAIVDNGYVYTNPIEISKSVNVILIIIVSMILSVMLSVFLIFFVRYLSGKIYTNEEVEKILGAKVLVNISYNVKKNKYERFFQVR